MRLPLKVTVLSLLSYAFWILALLGVGFAVHLIRLGAYPPPGGGSLGHVGIVIAGLISGFAAIVFALLGLYARLRARAAGRAPLSRIGAMVMGLLVCSTPAVPADNSSPAFEIHGRVLDATGEPVEAIWVSAMGPDDVPVRSAATGADGRFIISRLPAGRFDVAVRSPSQELARIKGVATKARDVDFHLSLATAAGKVVLPDGKPAPRGTAVEATSLDWAILRSVVTTENGGFVVKHLPPALVELRAMLPGYREAVRTVDLSREMSPIVLELKSACRLEVRVVEAKSGEGLPGVDVNIVEMIDRVPRHRWAGETNAGGSLVDTSVRAGEVTVIAVNPLHENGSVKTKVDAQGTTRVTVAVSRGAEFLVTLVDSTGASAGASGATVDAVPDTSALMRALGTTSGVYRGFPTQGRFRVRVPGGVYTVRAAVPAGGGRTLLGESQGRVRDGETLRVDLVLR